MSGPRVTSGTDSRQDYGTPANLLEPVQARFGPIIFDLAAHRLNKVTAKYFAPKYFTVTWDPTKNPPIREDIIESLVRRGANPDEATQLVTMVTTSTQGQKVKFDVPNHDPDAYYLDAFDHSWAVLHKTFPNKRGHLWLNCEFNDITPWAHQCQISATQGANILLLTPMVLTDWYIRHVAGSADVYQLSGRLSFDGKAPFPKDCMVSHFHPKATGALAIWDWRQDRILERWHLG